MDQDAQSRPFDPELPALPVIDRAKNHFAAERPLPIPPGKKDHRADPPPFR